MKDVKAYEIANNKKKNPIICGNILTTKYFERFT